MPEDGYEYAVGLKDEISEPAKRAAVGLDALTGALKRSETAAHGHASIIGRVSGAHAHLSLSARESAHSMREFASEALPGLVALASVAELTKGAFEGVKFAAEAGEFKDNAIAAYTIVRGTAEEGEATFAELDRVAREIHMPSEKAQEIAQRLMIEGLKGQEAVTDSIRAIGDLQRVGLGAGADKLQSIIERSISAGHFDIGKGARGLKGTGATMDAIAAELGMGRKQFDAELKAGRIDVETGIEAIDSVITKGKVGQLATKKFTISDAFTDLKNSIRGAFQETDSGPLTEALKEVSEEFAEGSERASDMHEALNDIMEIAGSLVHAAEGIGEAFSATFRGIKHAAEATYDWMAQHDPRTSAEEKRQSALKSQIGDALEDLRPLVDKRDKGMAALSAASAHGAKPEELRKIAKKYDMTISAGAHDVNRALGDQHKFDVVPNLVQAQGANTTFVASPPGKEAYEGRGREPVDVHRSTPAESQAELRALGADAAGSVAEGWKDKNKQHSPSEVMLDLGEGAATSLQSGFAAAAAFHKPEAERVGRTVAGSSKHIEVPVDVGGIHFHGVVDAESFMPLIESGIADVFDRVALELGQ